MKVVAFLPVKYESKRIDNKNVSLVGNKPLFQWMLETLLKCEEIDEVYLDTESDYIIEMAHNYPCKILKRDPSLATNATDGHQLLVNEAAQVEADIYVMALGTSPFLTSETIDRGIKKLKEESKYDSVVSVFKDKLYTWTDDKADYDLEHIPNSFDLSDTVIETMGLYIVRSDVVKNSKKRIGKTPYLLPVDRLESTDINFPEDFVLANRISSDFVLNSYNQNRIYSLFLNTAILSDALDNLGIKAGVLTDGFTPNFSPVKFCGHVRTISLKKLEDPQDEKRIYDGLKFLEKLKLGDVVMIGSEVPEFAYWGELMSTLAYKVGVQGAIVDGNTRDNIDTAKINFPVFAKGKYCKDTKYKAYVDAVDCGVEIDGMKVYPGDFVFADTDGVVVIDKNDKERVMEEALKIGKTENQIKNDILHNMSTQDLMSNHGMF
jgi:regulator of RNase E activity RraA/CMP-N-acetylneuraminic acid synthetase